VACEHLDAERPRFLDERALRVGTQVDDRRDLDPEVERLLRSGGESLYAELLYWLTYRRFPPAEAAAIWKAISRHQEALSRALGRPVAFRVAALDHLSESGLLTSAHLLARPEFEAMLSYVNIDEVSGVYSRRYFNRQLQQEIVRARRYGSALSLLIVDIDGCKAVNDELGHIEGDAILRKIARLLEESTREVDSVCRFGGDEFAILLPETNGLEAFATAERIRLAAARFSVVEKAKEPLRLTVSVGGATFPADCEDAEDLVALADRMCLSAKRAGKNRASIHGGPAERGEDALRGGPRGR